MKKYYFFKSIYKSCGIKQNVWIPAMVLVKTFSQSTKLIEIKNVIAI